MSISDWSSDVCSSDLPSRKGPPCVAGDTSIAAGCVGIHPICGRPALLPLCSRQPGETSPARASPAFVAGVAATPGVDRQLDADHVRALSEPFQIERAECRATVAQFVVSMSDEDRLKKHKK